ncbi:Coenzyme F420 hydrogenase/dehydrogenase, beta subunit C-terminal domain [Balneolaceae bacterium ANBcel3]|nr:Coenzyme F420 hydrogenase/dehydrogenase, beta subunit C-terminal domain [Balneolaceae bacterium ANBcel3]
MNPDTPHKLTDTVIKHDFCIGCGACTYVQPEAFKLTKDSFGMFKALPLEDHPEDGKPEQVCPFSETSINEQTLAEDLFPEAHIQFNGLGRYIRACAGYVAEGSYRSKGSSGGMGKWLLNRLLEEGHADTAIQVRSHPKDHRLFYYDCFKKGDSVLDGSTSAYYPVTLADILTHVRDTPGRYVITALPCFSKALRLLCRQDPILNERIRYVIGMVCGHLKSEAFAECLAWQRDVPPSELAGIEFREHIPGAKANDKGVIAYKKDGTCTDVISSRQLIGGNWGHGMFKYPACDACDDTVAETADITIGDAWLPRFMNQPEGTSLVIVRSVFFDNLISEGIKNQQLTLEPLKQAEVAASQDAGIRHKNEGLAYRMHLWQEKGMWHPPKRVHPHVPSSRRKRHLFKLRQEITEASHRLFSEAKAKGDFNYFRKEMSDRLEAYQNLYLPLWMRIAKRILMQLGLFNLAVRIKDAIAKKKSRR